MEWDPEQALIGPNTGPFADASQLQPGDWVFFVNHAWGDDTHSAIFIGWVDRDARLAMMVSYAGGHRDEPGRFGEYDLSGVFRVVRMTDDPPPPASTARTHRRHRTTASAPARRARSSARHPPRH